MYVYKTNVQNHPAMYTCQYFYKVKMKQYYLISAYTDNVTYSYSNFVFKIVYSCLIIAEIPTYLT